MATADEQIRISDRVKKRLDSRRRDGESYNDVLDRLLGETTDSDFEDGFGLLSDAEGEWVREQRADAKDERKERMRRLGDGRY
jgi:predicted CopG family antitoxin